MPPWGLRGLPVGLPLLAPLLSPQPGSLERVGGGLFGDLGKDLLDLRLLQGFLLDEPLDHHVQLLPVLRQDLPRLVVSLLDEAVNLGVDSGRNMIRVVLDVTEVSAQERLRLVLPERQGPEL